MASTEEMVVWETDFRLKRCFAAQKAVNKGSNPCPRHISGLALHGPPLDFVGRRQNTVFDGDKPVTNWPANQFKFRKIVEKIASKNISYFLKVSFQNFSLKGRTYIVFCVLIGNLNEVMVQNLVISIVFLKFPRLKLKYMLSI